MAIARLRYEYLDKLVNNVEYSGYEVSLLDGVVKNNITEIHIPDYYNGKEVISIGQEAFLGCENAKIISIGKNIKYIDNKAFDQCFSLRELYYNAVQAGVSASDSGRSTPFTGCGKDVGGYTLIIDKDVRIIPKYMFKSYDYNNTDELPTYIKAINFKNGVQVIEEEAFLQKGNQNFPKTIILPPTIESVAQNAFENKVHRKMSQPDLDYLAFTFNDKHSYNFNIYRTSDGNRYNISASPQSQDKTAEVPGGDGMYFFGATHKQKNFNISFAFDNLDEKKFQEMKRWLSDKDLHDLWFAEEPYKVYTAKVTGQPSIKVLPFDRIDENGEKVRIYKGEGTITFTAFWPYAHTPEFAGGKCSNVDGKQASSYDGFDNKSQWIAVAGLTDDSTCYGENPGDIPAPFIMKAPTTINQPALDALTFKVGNLVITVPAKSSIEEEDDSYTYTHHTNIEWDSKTGIVSAEIDGVRKPIQYTGTSIGGIPVGGLASDDIDIYDGTLKYHYWYY